MTLPFRVMPGPKSLPVIGSLLQYTPIGPYSFDRLHVAKLENYQQHGCVYREKLGPSADIVQVFDPESAGLVYRHEGRYPCRPALPITLAANKRDRLMLGLGSLNGEAWYKLRSSVQTLMMRPRAATVYLPAQCAVADDFLRLVKESLGDNGEVEDFYEMILKYTMESIGTVCFNSRLGCLQKQLPVNSPGERMLSATSAMFDAVQRTMFAFPWFLFFRSPLYKQFIEAKKQCDSIALSYVEDVKKCPIGDGSNGVNFLQSLIASEKLDSDRVVAVVNELFIAGIDSTANALSFAIYNLARNPDKQQRLVQEIDAVLAKVKVVDDVITPEHLSQMVYLKACVKESFRLNFPVEGGPIRILDKEVTLNNFNIPNGTMIAINHQTMCLQEKYFDRPGDFLPERWLKSGSATQRPPPRFVLLPFGYGPRMCIGRRFAEQEIYLALIKLLRAFRVEYHHESIGMINRVFTVPDGPVRVKFISRRPV